MKKDYVRWTYLHYSTDDYELISLRLISTVLTRHSPDWWLNRAYIGTEKWWSNYSWAQLEVTKERISRVSESQCTSFSYCSFLQLYACRRDCFCSVCQQFQGTFWWRICSSALLFGYRLRVNMRRSVYRSAGLTGLNETLHLTADVGSRRHLRSASTSTLVIPSTRRTTLGDRAFPLTAARVWNALPSSVRSAPSLLQFRRDLKTALFQSSYSSP